MTGDFAHPHGLGRRRSARMRSAPTPTPRPTRTWPRVRRRGIGLCRTEHMFFEGDRIAAVREMILAETAQGRRKPRSPSSCRCSGATSRASSGSWTGRPVTIRLLDPPLHEFLPHDRRGDRRGRQAMECQRGQAGAPSAAHEFNPHARPPRLPARHPLPGNLRDAGAGDLRGRRRGRPQDGRSRRRPRS